MDGPGLSLFQGGDSIRLNNSNQREEDEDFLEEEKIRKAELQDLINNAFSDLDEDDIDTDSSISSSRCSRAGRSRLSQVDHLRTESANNFPSDYSNRVQFPRIEQDPVKDSYNDNFHIVGHHVPFKGNVYGGEQFAENNHVSAHKNHCFHATSEKQDLHAEMYMQTDLNSSDQLKILYDVRLREIERLTRELEAEKEEKVIITRKLALCEHDKKNLEISLNANKTLLAESRSKISELESEVLKLKNHIKDIEKSKDEIRSELEITKTQLFHEQQKFAALERSDLNAKREKQMDLVIESLKTKHRNEIENLHQELDSAMDRIRKKEQDYDALADKLLEMEQKHSAHLLNKCDSTMRQEATIQALLEEANKEKIEMARQINALQNECSQLKKDLEQYDSFPSLRLNDNSSSDDKETDSFILMSSAWRSESKKKGLNLNQTDVVNKLKEELHRALIGQRTKRKDIMKLQEQVQAKELQITNLKEQERQYVSQLETLRGDMSKLLQHAEKSKPKEDAHLVAKLQIDIKDLENENTNKSQQIVNLEKELQILKEKLVSSEETNKKQSEQYLEFYERELSKLKTDSEQHLRDKELEWGREMEKMMTECDEVKKLYLEIKDKKDEVANKLHDVSLLYEELKLEKANLETQLFRKHQDIKELEDRIIKIGSKDKSLSEDDSYRSLQRELNDIIEKQNVEITSLKSKLHDAVKNDEELNNLRDEIRSSKIRYFELEKTLKEEFQESLVKLKEENSTLKDTLKKKEAELSLRKMCEMSQKREIAIGTEDSLILERINENNLSEIDKLEKEISRLKVLVEGKTQEILTLSSSQEQRINEALQQLEHRMSTQHQHELMIVEQKVKELALKSFSQEIEKLQAQHTENLKSLRIEDEKLIDELKQLLSRKDEEVRSLNSKKESLEGLVKKYEEERNKAAHIMTQWAKEVETIKKEKENLNEIVKKLQLSNSEISEAYEQLYSKLKETKKTALVYKRRLNETRTHLAEKYNNLMIAFQQKVDDVITTKELEVKERLQKIENEYKSKEKLLQIEERNNDIT